jgi:hypothetical protein
LQRVFLFWLAVSLKQSKPEAQAKESHSLAYRAMETAGMNA